VPVYVCMYVCVCACIYMYVCVCICMCVCYVSEYTPPLPISSSKSSHTSDRTYYYSPEVIFIRVQGVLRMYVRARFAIDSGPEVHASFPRGNQVRRNEVNEIIPPRKRDCPGVGLCVCEGREYSEIPFGREIISSRVRIVVTARCVPYVTAVVFKSFFARGDDVTIVFGIGTRRTRIGPCPPLSDHCRRRARYFSTFRRADLRQLITANRGTRFGVRQSFFG